MKKMKRFLIIPVKVSPTRDYDKIIEALRKAGENELAEHIRGTIEWCSVDPSNPYVEIRCDEKSADSADVGTE